MKHISFIVLIVYAFNQCKLNHKQATPTTNNTTLSDSVMILGKCREVCRNYYSDLHPFLLEPGYKKNVLSENINGISISYLNNIRGLYDIPTIYYIKTHTRHDSSEYFFVYNGGFITADGERYNVIQLNNIVEKITGQHNYTWGDSALATYERLFVLTKLSAAYFKQNTCAVQYRHCSDTDLLRMKQVTVIDANAKLHEIKSQLIDSTLYYLKNKRIVDAFWCMFVSNNLKAINTEDSTDHNMFYVIDHYYPALYIVKTDKYGRFKTHVINMDNKDFDIFCHSQLRTGKYK